MNERSIFAAALDIADPADRAAYLDRACAGDAGLRRHVEELLAAQSGLGSFLNRPAAGPDRTAAYEAKVEEGPGSRVGPYKLLQEIGEGGMGTVFMAEQEEPVRRMVAVKIIRAGMDSKGVLARFEAERQALALMDHPNIARVLDAGTTGGGSPYFVMELVKGVPITKFCDENQLSLRERLELFIPVCQAIQHAHMKGIIHRDVKPSNVLVAMYDDKPVPKVIDFGVAKATSQKLTDKTLFTAFGAVVGTLEYMSPEQAKLNQLDIDTRSDVYALGVLLYELLTGSTPLTRQRLKSAALDEVLRLIREEEPPKPSTRLSTAATLPQIAAARKSPAAQLGKVLRGELDWIVMKSLEKDRTRRYETAVGLAKDVQRYLSGDAVEACPPTLGYRLKKAYRRNKGAVWVATAFSAILLTATAVSVGFGVQAKRAEVEAVAARNGEAEQREEVGKQRDLAVKLGGEAAAERDNTKKALALAESEGDRVRRLLYASQMNAASLAFTEGRGSQLFRYLDEAVPRPGEPDLRGWEWHFLDRQTRTERQYKMDVAPSGPSTFPVRLDTRQASRDRRWIITRREIGEGFVYDVTEAATGRRVGQVPKNEVLRGGSLFPILSDDGRHMLVTEGRMPYPFAAFSPANPDENSPSRIWDVESGKAIPVPDDLTKKDVNRIPVTVVLGANAAWLAWLELTDPNPTRGALSSNFLKGPVEYTVARWEASSGKITRTKLNLGKGWGTARLGSDGRSVHWHPVDERTAVNGFANIGPDSNWEYGEYQVWDTARPEQAKLATRVPTNSTALVYSPNWAMLAVWDRQTITVHDLSSGRVHWQTPVPVGYVERGPRLGLGTGFHVSDDGNRIVLPSSDMATVIDRKRSGETVQRRRFFRDTRVESRGAGDVHSTLLPDGRTLTLRYQSTVRVWDVSEDSVAPGGRQFVPDGDGRSWLTMTTADGRRTVKWPAPPPRGAPAAGENAPPRHLLVLDGTGKELAKLELAPPGTNEGAATSEIQFVDSDRRLLLNTVRPKDTRPGVTYLSLPAGAGRQFDYTLEWALYDLEKPEFERVAGGTGSQTVIPNTGYLSWFESPTSSFAGALLGAVVGRTEIPLTLYDARSGGLIRKIPRSSGDPDRNQNLFRMIDPTEGRILRLTARGESSKMGSLRIEVQDLVSGKQRWETVVPDVQVVTAMGQFTPDRRRVVVSYSTTQGARLGVWSAATGEHERTLNLSDDVGKLRLGPGLTLSPDGRKVMVTMSGVEGPRNSVVYLGDVWNLDTGEKVQRLRNLGDGLGQMALSTDGTRLFVTDATPRPGTPGRLYVWDVTTVRELMTIPLDYDPNPYQTALTGLRYDAGKLYVEHPLWTRVLDGSSLPEPKK